MLCSGGEIGGQNIGVSGSLLGYFPSYKREELNGIILTHIAKLTPGFYLEATFLRPDHPKPWGFVNGGIGVNYFFPVLDSAIIEAELHSGQNLHFRGRHKVAIKGMYFRQAFEIPQQYSLFTFSLGYTVGWFFSSVTPVLPVNSAGFPYSEADFAPLALAPVKNNQLNFQFHLSGHYELEHFFLFGNYTIMVNGILLRDTQLRHGVSLGIFYPLLKINRRKNYNSNSM
ncbi:MAG: hypothetical protein M3R17_13175 [Bacteroidota bacterium]|nr:hypothetical protein [Bacteroidota bacterium]